MKKLLIPILIFAFVAPACTEDEPVIKSTLNFEVAHFLNSEAMVPGDMSYHSASDDTFNVLTLKYFLSAITLHESGGNELRLKDYFYIDGIDGTPKFSMDLPEGNYNKLSLYFGIPKDMNITGYFTDQPESLMEWPVMMGGGYHYMKMEGRYTEGLGTANYQLHTGPTGGTDFSIKYDFPVQLNVDGGNYTIRIGFDLEKWIESPNALFIKDMTKIMGKADVQAKLQENGVNVLRMINAN